MSAIEGMFYLQAAVFGFIGQKEKHENTEINVNFLECSFIHFLGCKQTRNDSHSSGGERWRLVVPNLILSVCLSLSLSLSLSRDRKKEKLLGSKVQL